MLITLVFFGVAALIWVGHAYEQARTRPPVAPIPVQDTPVPAPEATKEALEVNTYAFKVRKRVRTHLNHALATYLRAHGLEPTGDVWARARQSNIALVIGTIDDESREYVGAWGTLDEAVEALIGLDGESREEILTCMRVILPTSYAHLFDIQAWWSVPDNADEAEAHALAAAMIVRPVISTTAPMNATERLRAERKAAGLTARGTVPLPVCGARTRANTACKRKAQDNGRCDWHQAQVRVSA